MLHFVRFSLRTYPLRLAKLKMQVYVFRFCQCVAWLALDEQRDVSTRLPQVQKRLVKVLCLLEAQLPKASLRAVFHCIFHMSAQISLMGPLPRFWYGSRQARRVSPSVSF